jgi:hypothetical protein
VSTYLAALAAFNRAQWAALNAAPAERAAAEFAALVARNLFLLAARAANQESV